MERIEPMRNARCCPPASGLSHHHPLPNWS